MVVNTLCYTLMIEFITCISRFGIGLQSTRDTASTIGFLTCGMRVHHGYIGIAMICVAALVTRLRPSTTRWLLVMGMALFLSDMIHHFLVLWPITGSPGFHFVYPPTPGN